MTMHCRGLVYRDYGACPLGHPASVYRVAVLPDAAFSCTKLTPLVCLPKTIRYLEYASSSVWPSEVSIVHRTRQRYLHVLLPMVSDPILTTTTTICCLLAFPATELQSRAGGGGTAVTDSVSFVSETELRHCSRAVDDHERAGGASSAVEGV